MVPDETVVDVLRVRATSHPARLAFVRWADRREDERSLTYGALDARARAIGASLIARDLTGQRILLLVGPGLDYVAAFLGCLYAGAVAVPYYPPVGLASGSAGTAAARHSRAAAKLQHIVATAGPAAVICAEQSSRRTAATLAEVDPAAILGCDELLAGDADAWRRPDVSAASLAMLQFTSGSTGSPRGVMLTHGNLLHNSHVIRDAFSQDEEGVVVSWLPPYHDMGLIGGLLQPIYNGGRCVLLAPTEFLQRPRRWLEAIDRHEADTSGGPNFAYDLCVRRIAPEQRTGLRLSHWTLAFTGAEPIRADTLARFSDAFAPAGFAATSFFPCYGLAESTLAVTASRRHAGPRVASVDRAALERHVAVTQDAGGKLVVGSGTPAAAHRLLVVDPESAQELPPQHVGEIWVGSASVAAGYWRDPEATARTFAGRLATGDGPFLRTGDLGYLDATGELFIVGRARDLIIVRGKNHHPADIETTVERSHLVLRSGGCAAFGVAEDGGEAVVIVAEIDPRSGAARDGRHSDAALHAVATVIRTAVLEEHGLDSVSVHLVAAGSVPRTTSGKLERYACRERYLNHTLALVHASPAPARPTPDAADARPPATATERQVAAIWAEVLGVDEPALDDDFFESGGHSLLALELVEKLAQDTGAEITMRALVEHSTLERLARYVDEAPRASTVETPLRARPDERFMPFPLTDVQEAYLFGRSSAFELGGVATQGVAEFDAADFDPARLQTALDRLVRRHDMLRATVLADGRQIVHADVPAYPLEVHEIDDAGWDAALARIRERLAHSMLPVDRWPLFEIVVCRRPDGRARIFARFDLLIADLYSLRLLWRELGLLYADAATALPTLGLSFRDAIVGRRESPSSDDGFWRQRIPLLPPAPELPYAVPFRTIGTPRFTRRTVILDEQRWAAFRQRAAQAHVSPTAALLASFARTLAAWSRHPRFTLTLTFFNRPNAAGLDQVVGDFTSLLLVPVETAAADFQSIARHVQETLWETLDHRGTAGIPTLRELARLQGRTAHALMPVVFTSAVGHEPPQDISPWSWLGELVGGVSSTPQVALDHQVQENGRQLLLTWDSVDALFPAGLVDDMFGAYGALLDQLSGPDADWSAGLAPLVPVDHLRMITAANQTASALEPATLHGLFLRQAAARPDAIAVIAADGTSLSYAELERRSRAVAHWIERQHVPRDALVPIVMRKGWAQVVAALGVVRAGAAYLPIDPALPEERRFHLFERGRATIALTDAATDARVSWPAGLHRAIVDDLPGDDAAERAADPDDWTRLAYVIFTSGSTGVPKGVMIDHRGAVNTIVDLNARFGVAPGDAVFGLSSLGFDLSVYDVFGTLAAGATLVLSAPGAERDPKQWVELLHAHRVTLWNSVPALFEMLTDYLAGSPEPWPEALRLVWLSGDWIPVGLPDRARARKPGLTIISMGGATEASIWSIAYPIGRVDPSWRSIPYGRPLANQHMHVLDGAMTARPYWVAGDLYIGGIGVALGYWRDPDRTQASFVRHPITGERLYRTGDHGRWLPDGHIEFLGRDDGQVKIGGLRIELGEIESVLATHPDVRACSVVARHLAGTVASDASAASKRRLIAFVVPIDGRQLSEAAVRAWLEQKLPAGMIPTRFAVLGSMPLSGNGKIDVKALVLPASDDRPTARPLTETESGVRDIWAATLNLPAEAIGPDDSFFDLGGSSIALVQVAQALSARAGREIALLTLFEHPTVAQMARLVAVTPGSEGVRADVRAARRQRALSNLRRAAPDTAGSDR